MKLPRLACLILVSMAASSCNNTSHLLVYQHTNVGFCAGINPETSNVHVRLGIREENVIVAPKIEKDCDKTAASAFVATRVNVKSVFGTPEVNELVATGQAADNIARDPKSLDPFKTEHVAGED
ncbi:MAG TPA: hypothetical protein VGE39_13445 [Prosthecobacter sp.]